MTNQLKNRLSFLVSLEITKSYQHKFEHVLQTRLKAFAETVFVDFRLFHKFALESVVKNNQEQKIFK